MCLCVREKERGATRDVEMEVNCDGSKQEFAFNIKRIDRR